MLRLLLSFIVLNLYASTLNAQMVADKTVSDLGAIYNYNNDTCYFNLINTGYKTVYFLPVQPKDNFQVLCDTKTIAPGETINIGIIYYTEKKGGFTLQVPLYFSDSPDPLELTVKGTIKSISPNAITICPSIENSKPLNHTVPLNIIVRDRTTNQQIKEAKVEVMQGKKVKGCVPGFRSMAFQCNCDYGKINVGAKSEGYVSSSIPFNFNAENNTCLIYLDRYIPDTLVKTKEKEIVQQKDTGNEEVFVYIPVGVDKKDFNSTDYKPNHLIFVIDVSGSMKDSIKLGYLKTSMKALVSVLRPQDYITLITYAGKPSVIFENVNGTDKREIYDAIDSLHAKGSSLGSEALDMAYSMAHAHFIDGGNNQVFLATDGLFNGSNFNEKALFKMVKNESDRNHVKLTTIAFGKNSKALMFLEEMSVKGDGQNIRIVNMPADKELLIEEVKSQSLK